MKGLKFNLYCVIILFLIINVICIQYNYLISVEKATDLSEQNGLNLSVEETYKKQWLKNPNFSSQQYWYSTTKGDNSDVDSVINDGQANYKVIGDSGYFELTGNPFNASNWMNFINPKLPVLPRFKPKLCTVGCGGTNTFKHNRQLTAF
ncbi:MAG: hypothetical protein ACFFDF_25305 [Candidatus Odinarchaeota archaeon]